MNREGHKDVRKEAGRRTVTFKHRTFWNAIRTTCGL